MSNIEQKTITRALVNPSFQEISDYFGYDSKKYVPKTKFGSSAYP